MADTYKAVGVSAPGTLRVVQRSVSEPGAGQVRIRVEACGVCHSDAATVTRRAFEDSVCREFLGTKWWAVSRRWVPR